MNLHRDGPLGHRRRYLQQLPVTQRQRQDLAGVRQRGSVQIEIPVQRQLDAFSRLQPRKGEGQRAAAAAPVQRLAGIRRNHAPAGFLPRLFQVHLGEKILPLVQHVVNPVVVGPPQSGFIDVQVAGGGVQAAEHGHGQHHARNCAVILLPQRFHGDGGGHRPADTDNDEHAPGKLHLAEQVIDGGKGLLDPAPGEQVGAEEQRQCAHAQTAKADGTPGLFHAGEQQHKQKQAQQQRESHRQRHVSLRFQGVQFPVGAVGFHENLGQIHPCGGEFDQRVLIDVQVPPGKVQEGHQIPQVQPHGGRCGTQQRQGAAPVRKEPASVRQQHRRTVHHPEHHHQKGGNDVGLQHPRDAQRGHPEPLAVIRLQQVPQSRQHQRQEHHGQPLTDGGADVKFIHPVGVQKIQHREKHRAPVAQHLSHGVVRHKHRGKGRANHQHLEGQHHRGTQRAHDAGGI